MTIPASLRERAVFADTSALYAALDRSDQWHSRAADGFLRLAQQRRPFVTTNLVVGEVHTLALTRLGTAAGLQWLETAPSLVVVYQRETHHAGVLRTLQGYGGIALSYSDAFALVVMKEMGLGSVFTFDRGFQSAGSKIYPRRLF